MRILTSLMIALMCGNASRLTAQPAEKPNILFIAVDDLKPGIYVLQYASLNSFQHVQFIKE